MRSSAGSSPGANAIFAVAVLVSYSPVFLTRYGFLDDYPLLAELSVSPRGDTLPWALQQLCAIGRPTTAILYDLGFGRTASIEGLWLLRLLAAMAIALLGLTFAHLLLRLRWPRLDAFCTAFLIVTLPAFQVYAAWAAASFYVLACLLACAAVVLVERSARLRPRAALLGLVSAWLLQCVAFTIYQPAAMFYVVAWAAVLLSADPPRFSVRSLLPFSLVLAAALTTAFVVYQVGMRQFPSGVIGERSSLVLDPIAKLRWFIAAPLRDSLNLYNLKPSSALAWAVAIPAIAGILIRVRGSVFGIAVVLLVVVGSYLPNLSVREYWSAYRTQAALAASSLLLLVIGIQTLTRHARLQLVRRFALAVGVVVAASSAFRNTLDLFARPQALELAAVRSHMAAEARWQGTIVVKKTDWREAYARCVRYDEFGLPSTAATYTIRPMIQLIARERGADPSKLVIRVVDEEAPADLPANVSSILDLGDPTRD